MVASLEQIRSTRGVPDEDIVPELTIPPPTAMLPVAVMVALLTRPKEAWMVVRAIPGVDMRRLTVLDVLPLLVIEAEERTRCSSPIGAVGGVVIVTVSVFSFFGSPSSSLLSCLARRSAFTCSVRRETWFWSSLCDVEDSCSWLVRAVIRWF